MKAKISDLVASSRRPGRARASIALAVGGVIAVVAVSVAFGGTAAHKVTARPHHARVSAASVDDVITQVEAAFGDGLIQSASVDGQTVTVRTSASDDSADVRAEFDAAILGRAIADWQAGDGQTPATRVVSLDADSQSVSGGAYDVIGDDSSVSPLPSGTCEGVVAQAVPESIHVVSANTLPFASGTCVVVVESTAADAVAALETVVGVLPSGVANDHPYQVEVTDASGSPLISSNWVSGLGGGGEGMAFTKPGLPNVDHSGL